MSSCDDWEVIEDDVDWELLEEMSNWEIPEETPPPLEQPSASLVAKPFHPPTDPGRKEEEEEVIAEDWVKLENQENEEETRPGQPLPKEEDDADQAVSVPGKASEDIACREAEPAGAPRDQEARAGVGASQAPGSPKEQEAALPEHEAPPGEAGLAPAALQASLAPRASPRSNPFQALLQSSPQPLLCLPSELPPSQAAPLGLSQAAPLGLSEAAPLGLSQAAPPGLSQAAPLGLSQAAPLGLSQAAPLGLSEAAPLGLSEAAPLGLSQAAPLGLSQAAPPGLSQAAPLGLSQAAPLGLSQAAPLGLSEAAPLGLSQAAPPGLSQAAPLGLSQAAPLGLSQAAPLGLSEAAPLGLSQAAPLGLSQAAPPGLSQAAPLGLSQAAPLGLSQAAPLGLSQAAPLGLSQAAPLGLSHAAHLGFCPDAPLSHVAACLPEYWSQGFIQQDQSGYSTDELSEEEEEANDLSRLVRPGSQQVVTRQEGVPRFRGFRRLSPGRGTTHRMEAGAEALVDDMELQAESERPALLTRVRQALPESFPLLGLTARLLRGLSALAGFLMCCGGGLDDIED